jgi:hypothetical protein
MVKVFAEPAQLTVPLAKVGVTVMVAVAGAVPILIALKFEMSPVPLAASPIDVVLFIHEKVVTPPVLFVVKATDVPEPLHTTWLAG